MDYIDRLWIEIKRRKLSIKAIAEKAGVSSITIGQILLRKNTSPRLKTVLRICEGVGVKMEEIFKAEDETGGKE